ncbi:MAG: pyrimidine-nucleoside phosphorylase [Lachnospiraceae bacterium]|nr:pyrimidine-nucleoside phosphorylase [Lachnospiraceae bacterium]
MRMYDLIMKKRNGYALTEEEIKYMISGYTKGDIPDYQMSAFTMAVYFRGMNEEETYHLTMEMAHSGELLDLSGIPGIKVDKHSTGGVGDKTSLAVMPLLASFGLKSAKMSGRGLGHTGGTVDKLESFSGFHTEISMEQFINQVKDVGISIIGQTKDLAPADKKLYALRDVTATVENISLIASSIMSKKLAAGASVILLDVKTGSGAFMKTEADSVALAEEMVKIGKNAGRTMIAVISDMNQPLGNAVGNALEVKEAIATLNGEGPEDFTKLVYEIVSEFLLKTGLAKSKDEAFAMIDEKIAKKEGLEKLALFVEAQGGTKEEVYHPELLPKAEYVMEIKSDKEGYISHIQCEEIGICSMMLGGGREKKEDIIDPAVGIVLSKKVGDFVNDGETLAVMHYNSATHTPPLDAVKRFLSAYTISDEKPVKLPLIYKIID